MPEREESEGCVVEELIKLDDEEGITNKAIEVFLAERTMDWGEESGTWRWDDYIKEERERKGGRDLGEEKATQTVETGIERERIVTLVKTFPNLMKEDGLLPLPTEVDKLVVGEPRREWKQGGGLSSSPATSKGIPGGTSPYLPRLEGSVVIHPCCRTTCSVLSAPLTAPTTTSLFGVKKL